MVDLWVAAGVKNRERFGGSGCNTHSLRKMLAKALTAVLRQVAVGPTALEQFEYMQSNGGARFTQLPNYVRFPDSC